MTFQPKGSYNFSFRPDNVYGHAMDLLLRRKSALRQGEIHLDICCGYGSIAEKIESELGRIYVGVDGSLDGLASLAERRLESHVVVMEGRLETLRRLEEVIAGRPVGSISVLDAIEHFADGDEVLQAIAEIARKNLALVVVSVPNVTHRDIGAKLAFGRWNYTATGLLDGTHVRLFDYSLLSAVLEKAGLLVVDRHDIVQPESDQHFPSTHPALSAGTPLNSLLFEAAQRANPASEVNQFIWLCVPTREVERETITTVREEPRPLISVIIRTQGRRLHTLVEALTCLAGQTDTDFEAIVVGHKLEYEVFKAVELVVQDTPEWLRKKIRLLRVQDGGRSRPLNAGFAEARGRYMAILDDDDIPFGNWIEEYRKLDASSPGSVLRATSVRQDVGNVEIHKRKGLRAKGSPERIYPSKFNFLNHLVGNYSPNNTLAFPRGAFHDLGLRFDESLSTTEDWDYLLRVAAYCGVASSPVITGVYRWWVNHDSSRTQHSSEEWQRNYEAILRKQDESHFIVPKGGLAEIRKLVSSFRPLEVGECFGVPLESVEIKETFAPPVEELPAPPEPVEVVEIPAPPEPVEVADIPAPAEPAESEIPAPQVVFFGEGGIDYKLCSIDDAAFWVQRLSGNLPNDLARAVRRGLKRKCLSLKWRYYVSILNKKKRRDIRSQLRIYRRFLSEFR